MENSDVSGQVWKVVFMKTPKWQGTLNSITSVISNWKIAVVQLLREAVFLHFAALLLHHLAAFMKI